MLFFFGIFFQANLQCMHTGCEAGFLRSEFLKKGTMMGVTVWIVGVRTTSEKLFHWFQYMYLLPVKCCACAV